MAMHSVKRPYPAIVPTTVEIEDRKDIRETILTLARKYGPFEIARSLTIAKKKLAIEELQAQIDNM